MAVSIGRQKKCFFRQIKVRLPLHYGCACTVVISDADALLKTLTK